MTSGEGAGMEPTAVYCEECVETIPNNEVYWEEARMYCGRCGSELKIAAIAADVFEQIMAKKARPILKFENEEYDDEDEEERTTRRMETPRPRLAPSLIRAVGEDRKSVPPGNWTPPLPSRPASSRMTESAAPARPPDFPAPVAAPPAR